MHPPPGRIDHARDAELRGRRMHPWYRRAVLALMAAFCTAALLNLFGQRSESTQAAGEDASLALRAPVRMRSGDVFEARFEITARADLVAPRLVLDGGWLEGVSLNTVEPSPVQESADGGRLSLALHPMRAGDETTVWTQWQVNPTGFGRRDAGVTLFEGERELVRLDRRTTVFP